MFQMVRGRKSGSRRKVYNREKGGHPGLQGDWKMGLFEDAGPNICLRLNFNDEDEMVAKANSIHCRIRCDIRSAYLFVQDERIGVLQVG
jgi:hypothetical protein